MASRVQSAGLHNAWASGCTRRLPVSPADRAACHRSVADCVCENNAPLAGSFMNDECRKGSCLAVRVRKSCSFIRMFNFRDY